jgi:hypothetical protein
MYNLQYYLLILQFTEERHLPYVLLASTIMVGLAFMTPP